MNGSARADVEYLREASGDKREEADIEHLAVIEDLRELEARMLSEHMAILQADAQMLTMEGEILGQVQDQQNYDIESYVSQAEEVVTRKMEMYRRFLSYVHAFKAGMAKEESFSRRLAKDANGFQDPCVDIAAAQKSVKEQMQSPPRFEKRLVDQWVSEQMMEREQQTPRSRIHLA